MSDTLYAVLRAEIHEALQNRNRDDLIERVDELDDDTIADAQRRMVDHIVERLDVRQAIVRGNGAVACSCGSEEFTYQEGHPSERTMARNAAGALVFHGDFQWFDGDDDPGVVCASGHHVDTDRVDVDFY